jgi:hypothetical protein
MNVIDQTRYGPRAYRVDSEGEESQALIHSIVQKVKQSETGSREPIGKLVADAIDQVVDSKNYFHRLFAGGSHDLADIIKNASCFDIAVLVEKTLSSLGIASQRKANQLHLIPRHYYYTVLADGSVIDLFLRTSKKGSGYFASEEEYLAKLNKINSLGLSRYGKQIKSIFLGFKEP